MGNAVACTPNREDTLDQIESINPEEWTQSELSQWLKLTHDGDLSDLVTPFKQNKISGLTFVRLTNDDLKNKLNIKQFGLRDSFIVARDQVIEEYNHRQQNHTVSVVSLDDKTTTLNTLNTTLNVSNTHNVIQLPSASNTTTHSFDTDILSSNRSNSSKGDILSISGSPAPPPSYLTYQSPLSSPKSITTNSLTPNPPNTFDFNSNLNHNEKNITSSDILFANKKYLYIDLCRIICNGFCRNILYKNNIFFYHKQQWNILSRLCFDFYFEYQRHIEQFGHDLWKTLLVIEIATVPIPNSNNNDIIRGFTGYRLIKHIKQYLKRYDISEQLCMSLVTYSYIRLAAITDDNNNLIEKLQEHDRYNFIKNKFVNSKNYLYQFENKRHRGFIKSDEPDRQSWYKGCNVQIYSSTLNRWSIGQIIDINKDLITIQYMNNKQQTLRKKVDRYQDNVIKSTPQFIYNRKNWILDSQLEVFSNRYQKWFIGKVIQILPSALYTDQPHDILKIFYCNHENKEFNKYLERWSSNLREIQQHHPIQPIIASIPYKKGTNVMVWSNSKKMWIPGMVTEVIQQHKIVNVRYGDFEKLMPANSTDIRICDENAVSLLESYKKNNFQ